MDQMHINWFPGHMAKAHRTIREHLKLVDVVVELLDARIPYSSANPLIKEVLEGKPRVVALNKADLAEAHWTKAWIDHFKAEGVKAVPLEALGGKGAKHLVALLEQAGSDKIAKMTAKGLRPRAVRAMILGIPNVGKSSLINCLLGTSTVRTADKPGVTRGKQWIKVGKNLELLDTPGVLWPKLEEQEVALKLAMTGAIKDEVYDLEQAIVQFLALLRPEYEERLVERYKLEKPLPEENIHFLERIGAKRGCLRSGGVIDCEKAMRLLLNEFRSGKLGPITLDYPKQ